MIDLRELDEYRVESNWLFSELGTDYDRSINGVFVIAGNFFVNRVFPFPVQTDTFPPTTGFAYRVTLRVVAACGGGWDHVSVSTNDRCPAWNEMEFIKRQFFRADETAMQLHVPPKDHINVHPFVLHLWRPHDFMIPLPPESFV
jgi:hypothetical protein